MSIIPKKIRLLDAHIISQIAAGEVVERPASILKEMVENAMDAGATQIHVHWRHGGCSLVRVDDNGCGMTQEDIMMSVRRHTTSKLPNNILEAISTFGFRGEALSSIVAVARVKITSRTQDAEHGWMACFESGTMVSMDPCSAPIGTSIEVRDLFYATPARLKFMRSVSSEHRHLLDVFDRFYVSQHHIDFSVQWDNQKAKDRRGSLEQRLDHLFGHTFLKDSFVIGEEHLGYGLKGRLAVPTLHRATADRQIFFINGRSVKDRGIAACLRRAFGDTMPSGRHPLGVLFLDMPLEDVDVNVHPAKTEVRFLDTRFVYSFVESTIKKAILGNGLKSASLDFMPSVQQNRPRSSLDIQTPLSTINHSLIQQSPRLSIHHSHTDSADDVLMAAEDGGMSGFQPSKRSVSSECSNALYPESTSVSLGQAIGQVKNAYIVACNQDGLVLVDPHAAHERIVYEKMKTEWVCSVGNVQPFLLGYSFAVSPKTYAHLGRVVAVMRDLGFAYTLKDENMCHLLSVPAIFAHYDAKDLLEDLSDHVQEGQDPCHIIMQWRDHMMANWACRKSIRLGEKMSHQEMNALLRTIEKTPHGAQCNHGRSVYRMISMAELAHFFDRS